MEHPPFHCPNCRSKLPEYHGGTWSCPGCTETYRWYRGIPDLTVRTFMDEFKQTEQHFHDDRSLERPLQVREKRDSIFHQHFKQPFYDLAHGSTVLEVACGTRVDSIEIARSGKLVTALDISPQAVERGRDLAQERGAGEWMRFVIADGEHLPFADRSFDATLIAASFHHFSRQRTALHEMKRVTKPGGYVIWGVEPAAWPYTSVYRFLLPLRRYIRKRRARAHHSIADDTTAGYTKDQIVRLFQDVGLSIVEIKPVKFLSEFYDSGIRLIGRLIRRDLQPWLWLDHNLSRVDETLEHVPGLRKLFWHWNVISTVPTS